ncbi:MAG TPA: histidine phosphatase family protein [Acidimicrobiales bacterium]|nr:histidine phosphatase family protein [Acidimicrobiales bacterium]
MNLVVARHGRTTWNLAGRFQGHADSPLDATGRTQATALAAALAELPVVSVASSDLRRARDTAAAVARVHGLAVAELRALREVDLGTWEGLTATEAAARFPAEHARWREGRDVARGGGETRAAAGRRAAPVLAALAAEAAATGGIAVVVAHGYVLQAALATLVAGGAVAPMEGGAPHLGNGEWLALHCAG